MQEPCRGATSGYRWPTCLAVSVAQHHADSARLPAQDSSLTVRPFGAYLGCTTPQWSKTISSTFVVLRTCAFWGLGELACFQTDGDPALITNNNRRQRSLWGHYVHFHAGWRRWSLGVPSAQLSAAVEQTLQSLSSSPNLRLKWNGHFFADL